MPSTTTKRPRTAAQRANDQKMRDDALRTREANRRQHPEDAPASPDDLVQELANLFATASKDRGARQRDLADAERILGKMDPFKYPELADSPVIQRFVDQMAERTNQDPGVPPGTLVGTGLGLHKKIWQHKDVLDRMLIWEYGPDDPKWPQRDPAFEPVTFIPMETIPITWQGLTVTVISREVAKVPRCFYEIYEERNRALVTGEQFVQFLFKLRSHLDSSKVDVSILENPAVARIRSMGQGTYFPGAGGFDVGEEPAV